MQCKDLVPAVVAMQSEVRSEWGTLIAEILTKVMVHLAHLGSLQSVIVASQVCRRWAAVTFDPAVWESLALTRWSTVSARPLAAHGVPARWRELYIRRHQMDLVRAYNYAVAAAASTAAAGFVGGGGEADGAAAMGPGSGGGTGRTSTASGAGSGVGAGGGTGSNSSSSSSSNSNSNSNSSSNSSNSAAGNAPSCVMIEDCARVEGCPMQWDKLDPIPSRGRTVPSRECRTCSRTVLKCQNDEQMVAAQISGVLDGQ